MTVPGVLQAHDLTQLCYWLRAHGMRADPGQLIAAERLLKGLRDPLPAAQFGPWLAPIFSSSEADQSNFMFLYTRWIGQRKPDHAPPLKPPVAPVKPPFKEEPDWQAWAPLVLFAVLIAIVIAVLVDSRPHRTQVTVSGAGLPLSDATVRAAIPGPVIAKEADGRVVVRYRQWHLPFDIQASHPSHVRDGKVLVETRRLDTAIEQVDIALYAKPPSVEGRVSLAARRVQAIPAPARSQGPDVAVATERIVDLGIIAACTALMVGSLGWWFIIWLRRRGFLERLPAHGGERSRDVLMNAAPGLVAYAGDLRFLAREMRRRRKVDSRMLDVPATLAAALRTGTLNELVFGTRAEPDYLVLVDRAYPGDHQGQAVDEVLRVLSAKGVSMERYEFDADPRFARHAPMHGKPLHEGHQSFDKLTTRHPEARLIIFSDGFGLLDRYTNKPHPWLECLSAWRFACLFTPVPEPEWSLREWLLHRAGLALLPLDASGLHKLGEVYRQESAFPVIPAGAAGRDRSAYQRDLDLLLSQRILSGPMLETLMTDLRRGFADDGMDWLAGCAVYPELHWSLTLAVGDSIIPGRSGKATELQRTRYTQLLAKLVRLPWMRQGYMPDWLRAELIAGMSADRHAAIRASVAALLLAASLASQVKDVRSTLSVVLGPQNAWTDIVEGWRSLTRRRSDSKKQKDRVFLKFMSTRNKPLTFGVGAAWMALLYRDSAPLAGARLWPVAVATAAALSLAWVYPPVSTFLHWKPGPSISPVPAFVSLSLDGKTMMAADDTGMVTIANTADFDGTIAPGCAVKYSPGLALSEVGPQYANFIVPEKGGIAAVPVVRSCDRSVEQSSMQLREATGYAAGRVVTRTVSDAGKANPDALCYSFDGTSVTRFERRFFNNVMLAGSESALACAVSGDGRKLVVATEDGSLMELGLAGSSEILLNRAAGLPPGSKLLGLALDSSGKKIAALLQNGSVWLLRADASTWASIGMLGARTPFTMSGDGNSVAFATARREVELWNLAPSTGRNVLLTVENIANVFRIVTLPAGPLGDVADILVKRFGYSDLRGGAKIGVDDKVIILDSGLQASASVSIPVSGSLTVPTLQKFVTDMPAREVLTIVAMRGEQKQLTLPGVAGPADGAAAQAPRARWMLGLHPQRLRDLANQLGRTRGPMTGTMLVETMVKAAPGTGRTDMGIFYQPWKAAGHVAGDIILTPLSGPVTGGGEGQAGAATAAAAAAADVTLSDLNLGKFSDEVYFLARPLRVMFKKTVTDSAAEVVIPAGFVTSHNAVPRVFWSIFPPDGTMTVASVVADYLYWQQSYSREQSDDMVRRVIISLGANDSKAKIIYTAMRAYGQQVWIENERQQKEGEQRFMAILPEGTVTWADYKTNPDVFKRKVLSAERLKAMEAAAGGSASARVRPKPRQMSE